MIRLLLVVDSVAANAGLEKQILELIRRIDPQCFEVHLACIEDSAVLRDLAVQCRVSVYPMESIFSRPGWRGIRALRRYIDANRIDIAHAFLPKSAILAVMAARNSCCRAVITSRRNTGYWYTPRRRWLMSYLNRRTTRVLANSKKAKQVAVDHERLAPGKVDVLYNGVDLARYAPAAGNPATAAALGIPASAPVVGMVANLRPVKDIPLFLRAAAIVAGQVPEARFLLVGDGPRRAELARLAQDLGIAARVFFTAGCGAVPDYLSRMCVGCLSSESEGFSNAILEYMAAGLPVVATDAGGNAEAVEDGCTGYIVRTRKPEDFAAPIIRLLRDESHWCAMGALGRERCEKFFDITAAVRQVEHYYVALLHPGE